MTWRRRLAFLLPRAGALVSLATLLACLLADIPPARAAEAVPTAADPALEARVLAVSAELRCLVCQNQSIADSHAGLALDLKNQVREQLRAGRHPDEVVAYMTRRYGDFIRYRPPWAARTLLLWMGPLLLLLAASWTLARALRTRPAPASAREDGSPWSDEEARMVQRLSGADGASPSAASSTVP